MNYVVISYAMITNRARVSGQVGQGRLPWEGQNLSWGITMASVLIFSHILSISILLLLKNLPSLPAALCIKFQLRMDNFQIFLVEVFYFLINEILNRTVIQKAMKNNDIFLQVVLVLYGCWEIFISSSLDAFISSSLQAFL